MSETRPVVVLGAGGFLGSAVTAALAGRAVPVRAVTRQPAGAARAADHLVEHVHADLGDPAAVARAVRGAGAVVNLAAAIGGSGSWRFDRADGTDAVNRDLVGLLVRLLADGPARVALVFASSTSLARPAGSVVDGTEPDEPSGVYACQKSAAEQSLRRGTLDGLVDGVTVRLPTVYGISPGPAGAGRGVVAAMARRAVEDRPLTLWNDGTTRRDLLHVDDAARAVVDALGHAGSLAGRHWVVGTGIGTPLGRLFALVAGEVARVTARRPVPVVRESPPDGSPPSDHQDHVVDAAAFTARTGWRPEASLDDEIRRTVAAVAR